MYSYAESTWQQHQWRRHSHSGLQSSLTALRNIAESLKPTTRTHLLWADCKRLRNRNRNSALLIPYHTIPAYHPGRRGLDLPQLYWFSPSATVVRFVGINGRQTGFRFVESIARNQKISNRFTFGLENRLHPCLLLKLQEYETRPRVGTWTEKCGNWTLYTISLKTSSMTMRLRQI